MEEAKDRVAVAAQVEDMKAVAVAADIATENRCCI
jgi:hypothetical protein